MNDNGNWDMDDLINLAEGEITYEQWESKYKPVINHLDKYSPPADPSRMFETYGEEYDYVCSQDPKYVWTMVDGDMSTLLVPGRSIINRLAYYVCEVPWEDDNEVVVLSLEIECHCYDENEFEGDPNCDTCEGYGLRPVSPEDPEVKLYAEENK